MRWRRCCVDCDEWIIRDCGAARTVVALPGWATDGRILERVEWGGNVIVVRHALAEGLQERLTGELARRHAAGQHVTLLGWSLGGYVAAEIARQHPRWVDHLVLVGMRPQYPVKQLETMRGAIERDRVACLTGFYRQCFLPAQKEDFRWFRRELMPAYLKEMDAPRLLRGLDYLAQGRLNLDVPCAVTLVHGQQDVVAPVEELETAGAMLGKSEIRNRNDESMTKEQEAMTNESFGIGDSGFARHSGFELRGSADPTPGRVKMDVYPDAGHAAFLHPIFVAMLPHG